ncbi:MAG TPA: hypothetical protein ENH20_00295 [Candidatus Pacearchaeota archaeon]|nr:hypothetical protein [Candidatus Pacearchaeota archaeon]
MIIGIVLGISLAVNIVSLLIIVTSTTGILQENLVTGAVIGAAQASSYATIALIISLIITFALILYLKKPKY